MATLIQHPAFHSTLRTLNVSVTDLLVRVVNDADDIQTSLDNAKAHLGGDDSRLDLIAPNEGDRMATATLTVAGFSVKIAGMASIGRSMSRWICDSESAPMVYRSCLENCYNSDVQSFHDALSKLFLDQLINANTKGYSLQDRSNPAILDQINDSVIAGLSDGAAMSVSAFISSVFTDSRLAEPFFTKLSLSSTIVRDPLGSEYDYFIHNIALSSEVMNNLATHYAQTKGLSRLECVTSLFLNSDVMQETKVSIDPEVLALRDGSKKPSAPRQPKAPKDPNAPKAARTNSGGEFPALSASFMRGKLKGQVDSIYKDIGNVERCRQFVAALDAGKLTETKEALQGYGATTVRKYNEIVTAAQANSSPAEEAPAQVEGA